MSRAQWDIAFDDSPSLDEFTEMAEAALAEIPAEFRRHIEGVGLRIEDWPDQGTLRRMRIGHPLGLLGLYSGLPIGYKQAGAVVQHIDMIFLYREPILAHWRARGGRSGGRLKDVVKHVLVHEIGHHFGLSDADMERIESEGD